MKTMAAGKFKAQCLAVIDEVHNSRQEVVITKHGKPMAKLAPLRRSADGIFGAMRSLGKIRGDLIGPIFSPKEWDTEVFRIGEAVSAGDSPRHTRCHLAVAGARPSFGLSEEIRSPMQSRRGCSGYFQREPV